MKRQRATATRCRDRCVRSSPAISVTACTPFDPAGPDVSAAITGASLVPVMVIVTGWVDEVPLATPCSVGDRHLIGDLQRLAGGEEVEAVVGGAVVEADRTRTRSRCCRLGQRQRCSPPSGPRSGPRVSAPPDHAYVGAAWLTVWVSVRSTSVKRQRATRHRCRHRCVGQPGPLGHRMHLVPPVPEVSAAITGASLVPVMVIVTGWVDEVPLRDPVAQVGDRHLIGDLQRLAGGEEVEAVVGGSVVETDRTRTGMGAVALGQNQRCRRRQGRGLARRQRAARPYIGRRRLAYRMGIGEIDIGEAQRATRDIGRRSPVRWSARPARSPNAAPCRRCRRYPPRSQARRWCR